MISKRLWSLAITLLLSLCFLSILHAQSTTPRRVLVDHIAKSGNGQVLAVTYNDYSIGNLVDFFDCATGDLLSTADLAPHTPLLINLSPTGDRLLWADSGSNIGVYDRNSGTNEAVVPGGFYLLNALDWNPINDVIAWSLGTSVTFYDIDTRQNLGSILSDAEPVVSFAWSPDGNKIATSHYAEDIILNPGQALVTVQLWDVSSINPEMRTPLLNIDDHGGGKIVWSPDGTRFAGLESGGIFLYNLSTSSLSTIDFGLETGQTVIEWSPDGSQLATGGSVIRIWNTETLQLVDEISVGSGVSSLQWAADGQHVFNNGGGEGLYLDEAALVDLVSPPIANAGPDQTLTDGDGNGSELVTFDGSGSGDPDGTTVSYSWSEGGIEIATGVNPQVDLAVGLHTITLTVTDDDGATATDKVIITVNAPPPMMPDTGLRGPYSDVSHRKLMDTLSNDAPR